MSEQTTPNGTPGKAYQATNAAAKRLREEYPERYAAILEEERERFGVLTKAQLRRREEAERVAAQRAEIEAQVRADVLAELHARGVSVV